MRSWLSPLFLIAVLPAADAQDTRRLRDLDRKEKAYWKTFDRRFREAATAWYEPVRTQRHTNDNEPVLDLRPLRALYRELEEIEKSRATAHVEGATTADRKKKKRLRAVFLSTLESIAAAETELSKVRKRAWRLILDQRPAFRRESLETRLRTLQAALRKSGDRAELAAALPELAKKDGRGYPWRRIGVLDALRGSPWETVRGLADGLAHRSPAVRAATLEVFLRAGPQGQAPCIPLLEDPSVGVRRLLVESIPREHRDVWLEPLTRTYLRATGRLRRDCVETLESLTGRRLGDAPEAWAKILKGQPLPTNATKPGSAGPRFYGLPVRSERIFFLAEGSFAFTVPAQYEVQRTRPIIDWGTWGSSDWKKKHRSHQQVLAVQLEQTLRSLPEKAAFRIAMMGHPGNAVGDVSRLEGRRGKLLSISAKNIARARRFIAEHKVAFVHDLDLGLRRALAWPGHDTVLVFGTGQITGGRFCLPEHLLANFRRGNRFRRLVVHCVRVCHAGPDAASLLRDLARSSGGSYVWSTEPPPS